ncbi:MAG: hypothetical protein ABIA02_03405 [Candidatus Falkowbacteria bacterium]
MSNINFLLNKKEDNSQKKGSNKEKIKWSNPKDKMEKNDEKKKVKQAQILTEEKKGKAGEKNFMDKLFDFLKKTKSTVFSFMKKKEQEPKSKDNVKPQSVKDQKWENPHIVGTNLIEEEIVFLFDWKKGAIRFSLGIILSCFSVGAIYTGLVFWQNQKEIEGEIIVEKFNQLNKEIAIAEKGVDEVLAFQEKIDKASFLLDNHIYWTNFFEFLEKNTLADVYYQDFTGDLSGNYNFSVIGKNFNTIDQQIKAFKEDELVFDVKVESGNSNAGEGSSESEQVDFSMDISVDPKIFYK